MSEFTLLKHQRNNIFEFIESCELKPADFRWEFVPIAPRKTATRLVYRKTNFYFAFIDGIAVVRFSPGSEYATEDHRTGDWDDCLYCVRDWLGYLKREISEPDLWEQLAQRASEAGVKLPVVSRADDSRFTAPEVARITTGLNRIRALLVENAHENRNHRALIESQLDYLVAQASKRRRIDWWNIAVGTLLQLTITLTLDPAQAHKAWMLLKATVTGVAGFLGG